MKKNYYKQSGNTYFFYDINLLLIIIGIFLFAFSIYQLSNYNMKDFFEFENFNRVIKGLAPVWLLLSPLILGIGVVRVRLLPADNKITKEFLFGAWKKSYEFNRPVSLKVIARYKNDIFVESDVHIQTIKKNIVLKNFAKFQTKGIDGFLDETKQILK